ncbi:hypothetical protein [Amycolatopsis sp. cg9]|uniref:hypothetical protein n=1 Tax=Amycolatopsis sp. cg9 TaxID=3238801 RepID=UPI0035237B42
MTSSDQAGHGARSQAPPSDRRVEVRHDASGIVSTGDNAINIQADEVTLLTGSPVRTRYRRQVSRLAPAQLDDRETELAELAEFCLSPETAGHYQWWQGGAWSGKTALASWFVLHPPAGLRIVSFFITGRLAAQNDRAAFIDNVLEQLLALLGHPWPSSLTDSSKEGHLLEYLAEAAEASNNHGERFVLLVDGLDEDRSVHTGPQSHSIASLLPTRPPAGMRIIVTGRPNPPIPDDVPPDHPLHGGTAIRTLTPSPRAQIIRRDAHRELKGLLRGTRVERDLLGLVAAANGGLSATDLAELTGLSAWDVDDHLRSVIGRSFTTRSSHSLRGGPQVFLLGHETLQVAAGEMLGAAHIAGYRDRIHAWAQEYQARRWPIGTPEYLLLGYFRTLGGDDVETMVNYATDPARQYRLFSVTGSEYAAISEIAATQDLLAAQDEPDLIAMTRLAIHEEDLSLRSSSVPRHLPAVWAALGQITRAETIAHSYRNFERRIEALVSLSGFMIGQGEHERAAALLGHAESLIAHLQHSAARDSLLCDISKSTASNGDFLRAEEIAEFIIKPEYRANALVSIAQVAAAADACTRANELVERVEAIVRSVEYGSSGLTLASASRAAAAAAGAVRDRARSRELLDLAESVARDAGPWNHNIALTMVAEAAASAAATADRALASDLLDRAATIAHSISHDRLSEETLLSVARAAVAAGRIPVSELLDRAETLAHSFTNPAGVTGQLTELVEAGAAAAAADRGQAAELLGRVETITQSITGHHGHRVRALASIARAAAATGDHEKATDLLEQAETAARSITEPAVLAYEYVTIAEAATAVGHQQQASKLLEQAEAVARIPSPHRRAAAFTSVVKGFCAAGHFKDAEKIADFITEPDRGPALASVVESAVSAGHLEHAESIARSITSHSERMRAFNLVAVASAEAGRREWAETIARSIAEPAERARTLIDLAVVANDLETAKSLVRTVTGPDTQARLLRKVARTLAAGSDIEQASTIAQSIDEPSVRAEALAELAEAAAAAGRLDSAKTLAYLSIEAGTGTPSSSTTYHLLHALTAAGDLEGAEALACTDAGADSRGSTVARLAQALARAGYFERAETTARSITQPEDRNHALHWVADAAAAHLEFSVTERVARSITDTFSRTLSLVTLSRALSAAEHFAQAERVARSLDDPEEQALALGNIAECAATAGDFDRADAIMRSISSSSVWMRTRMVLAEHDHRSDRVHALADALRTTKWTDWLPSLLLLCPDAGPAILAEIAGLEQPKTIVDGRAFENR